MNTSPAALTTSAWPGDVRVLAFVMAGGEGSRLFPLTTGRCKPSVPFDGRHRIVDFVLSNLTNSAVSSIYLLVQYKSQALIEHVRRTWTIGGAGAQHFVTVVPPQMTCGPDWFQGTADAVYQNLALVDDFAPDLVAVFSADHVYRMDVRQMVAAHVQAQADVSVAAIPVPLAGASSFGIVDVDDACRITRFSEKPALATPMPGRASHALASMGNYIFSVDVLRHELKAARERGESDFGQHILPRMVQTHRLLAYDFEANRIAGVADFEQPAYWRDVGTIDAYFAAHLDTLGPRPRFRLDNLHWPIRAHPDALEPTQIEGGSIRRSVIASGCVINDARLDHAMLRSAVHVDDDARVEHAIVMDRCRIGRGARLRCVILDQDNDVPPFETIGVDHDADRRRFHISDGGVVVVPRGYFARRSSDKPT